MAETEEERRPAAPAMTAQEMKTWWDWGKDIIGTVFSWGFPALIFGSILLLAAGPISTLLPDGDWKNNFLAFTGKVKDEINGMFSEIAPNGIFTKTAEEINALEAVTKEAAQNAPVADVQAALAKQLGGDALATNMANQIVRNDNDKQTLLSFMEQENISPTNPDRMKDPAVLARFIQQNSATMQRIVGALPAGNGATVPEVLKAPLRQLLGNPQNLQAMLANPAHKAWIEQAFQRFSGASAPEATLALNVLNTNPTQFATLMDAAISGSKTPATLTAEITALIAHAAQTSREIATSVAQTSYDAKKADPTYAAIFTLLENGNLNFREEAIAAFAGGLQQGTPNETIMLQLITAKPERISALKGLSDEQLAPVLSALKLPESIAPLMQTKASRDAMLTTFEALAKTNSEGNNELAGVLSTMNTQNNNPFMQAATLRTYIDTNPARMTAFVQLKASLETQAAQAADTEAVRAPYNQAISMIATLTSTSPSQVQAVASATAAAPAIVQAHLSALTQSPTNYIADLMANDAARNELGQAASDGKRNSVHLGAALEAMLPTATAEQRPMLQLLAKKDTHGVYTNLEAMLAAANTIDQHTGADQHAVNTLLTIEEANRTAEEKAALEKLATDEAAGDTANIQSVAAFLGLIQGGNIEQTQAPQPWRLGALNHGSGQYQITTPLKDEHGNFFNVTTNAEALTSRLAPMMPAISTLLETLNVDELSEEQQSLINDLRQHMWVDENNNGQVDSGDRGLAEAVVNPYVLGLMLAEKSGINVGVWGDQANGEQPIDLFELSSANRVKTVWDQLSITVGKAFEASEIAAPNAVATIPAENLINRS